VGGPLIGSGQRFGGKPSSGWRHWLCCLGGIIGVVSGLNPRWASNVGKK
jgi:hypothetical protein